MDDHNTHTDAHHNNDGHYGNQGKFNFSGGTHDFAAHAEYMLGIDILAPGQTQYGGYAHLNENYIVARSPITGLRPVIEQAITQIVGNRTIDQAIQRYGSRDALEAKIAQQLTNLNDWNQLTQETQNEIMILTGINFDGMTAAEQEKTINHLQHSPLPFGDLDEVLSSSVKIDLGITHTLDKNMTEVEDLGDGVWKITMISNNNNGSHTGHNLGSFKVDLGAAATADIAKKIGNDMVVNTNNNNQLYLDQAARDVLYGASEKLDLAKLDAGHDHGGGATPGAGHDFYEHLSSLMPTTLSESQDRYGGYSYINETHIIGRSPITGMKPVIEQAIKQIVGNRTLEQAAKIYGGYDKLESKIANQLTNLNDWENLTEETQAEIMILTGINVDGLSAADREKYVNHLLHSPLPFGAIEGVIGTNVKIELGYTHTLDKNKTEVADMGDGIWEIKMISNNNNGSHTGHNLGSFRIDLGANGNADLAKKIGNQMVVNTNDNNKLYLDQAARNVLYGQEEENNFDMENAYNPHANHGPHAPVVDGDNIYGSKADDFLTGTDADNIILGGDGVDVMYGGKGDDLLDGEGGDYNQVNYDGSAADYRFVVNADGSVTVTNPVYGTDTLKNIDGIWFNDEAKWYPIADLLTTEPEPTPPTTGNVITATAEGGYLAGTDGDDVFAGGDGVDVFYGGKGDDTYQGGGEYNQVDYDGAAADYQFVKNADDTVTVSHPVFGTDTLKDIHGMWFAGENKWYVIDDLLTAEPGPTPPTTDNVISATEQGGYLGGTEANDLFKGAGGTDVFYGGRGDDVFEGAGGYNQVDYDGAAADYTFARAADGTVTVTHPEYGTDTLKDIGGMWFSGENKWYDIDALAIPVPGETNVVEASPDGGYFRGTHGSDEFRGGNGVDVFYGGKGDDVYDGAGGDYNQVDLDGSKADYTFTRNDDGTVTAASAEYGHDVLKDIDGIWFYGEEVWSSVDELA